MTAWATGVDAHPTIYVLPWGIPRAATGTRWMLGRRGGPAVQLACLGGFVSFVSSRRKEGRTTRMLRSPGSRFHGMGGRTIVTINCHPLL